MKVSVIMAVLGLMGVCVCKMTQEFVAEAVGVSRQAVSKWEMGATDPSTSNLLALARLFDVSAEDLLRAVAANTTE